MHERVAFRRLDWQPGMRSALVCHHLSAAVVWGSEVHLEVPLLEGEPGEVAERAEGKGVGG
jgi:hypothetical protein